MLLISTKSRFEEGALSYCYCLSPVQKGEVIWMKDGHSYKKFFKKDFISFIRLFSKDEIAHILKISFIKDGVVYVPKDDHFFFTDSDDPNCSLNEMGLAKTTRTLLPQEPITLDFDKSFDHCNFHRFTSHWVESKEEIIDQIKKFIGLTFKGQTLRRAV